MNPRLNQRPVSQRHVDLPTGQAFRTITVPGIEKPNLTCPLWPDCDCETDCTAGNERAGRVRWLLYALVAATAVIGAGLLYAALRFNWIFFGAMAASISTDAGIVWLVLR